MAVTWAEGLFAELDVPAEAGQVLVAGFGLELGGGAAVDGQVLEGGVPQLVERPVLLVRIEGCGRRLEQVLGARVGQSAAPGLGADVGGRRSTRPGGGGAPVGEEDWAGGAAAQEPGQEAGGAGGPVDVLDRAALGVDAAAPEPQVEVLDVEGQEFFGAGGGLVQHPPQDPLAKAVPVVGEQLVQACARDGAVAAAGNRPRSRGCSDHRGPRELWGYLLTPASGAFPSSPAVTASPSASDPGFGHVHALGVNPADGHELGAAWSGGAAAERVQLRVVAAVYMRIAIGRVNR